MKTLFVGSTEKYLYNVACQHDNTAYLLDKNNYQEFLNNNANCTVFTSLGDLPKNTDIFLKILLESDVIYYCPSELWKLHSQKNILFNSTNTEQGLTELFLLFVAKFKKVVGIELISNHHSTLDMHVHRQTDDAVLWTAGCSNTFGIGVSPSQTYSCLLAESLQRPLYNLSQPGTSNQWSADQILRADIQKQDIVVWGLTNSERITWVEDGNFIKLNASNFTANTKIKSIVSPKQLVSENTLHANLTSIEQVANFCKKIGATFLCFLTLPTDASLYKFLFNKDYFLNINFEFCIGKNNQWHLKRIDYGTDNQHPGPLHHQFWHSEILKTLGTH